MDIKNIHSVRAPYMVSSVKKEQNKNQKFTVKDKEITAKTSNIKKNSATVALDGLFLLINEEEDSNQKAFNKSHLILDYLEKIRLGLINGAISRQSLKELSQLLHSQIITVSDPSLQSLMNEIEIRAQVELAKLENL